jgi:hypothetical protein
MGVRDAVLVDAFMTVKQANAPADWVAARGKNLTEAYCLAHHVTADGGKRRLMFASLRYLDTFVKIDGAWFFLERLLYVDWIDERPLS